MKQFFTILFSFSTIVSSKAQTAPTSTGFDGTALVNFVTNGASPQTATNVLGTGFDVTGITSNLVNIIAQYGGTATGPSGSTTDRFIRVSRNASPTSVTEVRIKSNNSAAFKLNSITVNYSATPSQTQDVTLVGYLNGVAVPGATLTQGATASFTWMVYNVSSINSFSNINEMRLLLTTNGGSAGQTINFDNISILPAVTVPLSWLSITANKSQQNTSTINWLVQEQNVAQYEIQKSTDGRSFLNIGTVASKGNGQHNYSFTDAAALTGTGFYRIRQVDVDGRSSLSAIVKLGSTNEKAVSVYPIPARSTVVVTVPQTLVTTNATLFDNTGKQIRTILLTNTVATIDVSDLPSGIYVLRFTNGSTSKLVKE